MPYPAVKCFLVEKDPHGRWVRRDTGERHPYPHQFGPGAMFYNDHYADCIDPKHRDYNEDWRRHWHLGPDGKVLIVVCPNGRSWIIDSYCSNCTRRGEDHSCWCRHGEPPFITVDKICNPGETTCAAGAGSIQAGDYHGFLQNGMLTAG
jgi:hypothetical protein